MGTSTQAPAAKRHFIIEIWDEKREAFKALVADALLFLAALAVLFAVFLALRAMERAGYGLKNTLAALQEKPVELPGVAQEVVDGEVLFKNELDFAYDFSMFHQPEVSFEQFLEQRFKCKNNAMYISKLFDKDFAECHLSLDRGVLPSNR